MSQSLKQSPWPAPRRSPRGYSVMEVFIMVVVLGVLAAVALPNFLEAYSRSQRQASYDSALRIESALNEYLVELDGPPTSLNVYTLEPLVREGVLTHEEATAVLATFEDERLQWYFGWTDAWGGWWEQDFALSFRPQGDPDALCTMYPEATWCWFPEEGWEKVSG